MLPRPSGTTSASPIFPYRLFLRAVGAAKGPRRGLASAQARDGGEEGRRASSLLRLPRRRGPAPRRSVSRAAKTRERATAAQNHRRSEEHTSEPQSLIRRSHAGFCLKNKQTITYYTANRS